MKIGYFEHWSRPLWSFIEFLKKENYDIEKIDYRQKNYLEKFDVVIVEQNGFNDYIENDELYIQDWVSRGGFFLFMHQDYCRWAPCFLPEELQNTNLIHRHVYTIGCNSTEGETEPYTCYMMPWPEGKGRELFNYPEKIDLSEMLSWHINVNSFTILRASLDEDISQRVRTSALSCFLADSKWEVLGSYMDPAVRDGALILQGRHGKGLYFLNQILVPETDRPENERCLAFWRKYMRNLLCYFENFRNNVSVPVPQPGSLKPGKKNYKLCIHMHSLDWYGCDSAPGTINALMHQMNYDICALALKDAAPYKGKLDPAKYSDDRVLFLDGQEYHPFNWGDKNDHISHNGYHILAVGTDHDAYTPKYTKSIYGDAEVDEYLNDALKYINDNHGVSVATHPNENGYWHDYPVDAVDMEPLGSLVGTHIESYYLKGGHKAVMNSVDLFGTRRMYFNPAVNFIYLADNAVPCRDSVVAAVKNGNTIAACGFDEADISCEGAIPGSVVRKSSSMSLHISAKIAGENVREVRIYADDKVILCDSIDVEKLDKDYTVDPGSAEKFIRVEISGESKSRIAVATPFYFK